MSNLNTAENIGCAMNVDGDFFYHIYKSVGGNVSDAENILKSYVRGFADKGISDFILNCYTQSSMVPSKVMFWAGDKYYQKEENGIAVDYSDNIWVRSFVEFYKASKEDPVKVLLDEIKLCGMNSWVSVRMNDAHLLEEPTCRLRGEMYYEALNKGMMIGKHVVGDYWAKCLDYSYAFIREKMLAYICELVDRYDMDGLELDFQRDIFCFDYRKNPECCKIMTEFVSKVRAYLCEKEKDRGHKIRLGVRVCPDIAHCRIFGFDVEAWTKQGLVDVLVPTPRWECSDSTMDISKWKEMTAGTGVEIYAGIEHLLARPIFQSVETVKGFATQYLDAGADKIYLFNWFRLRAKDMQESDFEKEEDYRLYLENVEFDALLDQIWNVCSDRENAKAGVRRHVMTYREECMVPVGEAQIRPLPVAITGEKTFYLQTGDCESRRVTLFAGVKQGEIPPIITVDGKEAVLCGKTNDAYYCSPVLIPDEINGYKNTDFYAYEVTPADGNVREIIVKGTDLTLEYLEIKVD